MRDLEKMKPTWEASRLYLAEGLNIRRETGELIRIFRMLDGRFWKVYVYYNKRMGIRHFDRAYVKLTLKEAIALVQHHIREINGSELERLSKENAFRGDQNRQQKIQL